jgi:hypothetical protein
MFRPTVVVSRQREVKHTSTDMLGSPTVTDDYMPTKKGDLNNRTGGAFHWGSQVLYKEDTTRRGFSSISELKATSKFP